MDISNGITTVTVNITPNYKQMFKRFASEFSSAAKDLSALNLDVHYEVHGILAAFNVALHSATSNEEIEELRDRLCRAVEESSNSLAKKQQREDEEEFGSR